MYQPQKLPFLIRVTYVFLISNFCRVLNVICLLLGDSPVSGFYMPTFRNALSSFYTYLPAYEDGIDRVFRNVGI